MTGGYRRGPPFVPLPLPGEPEARDVGVVRPWSAGPLGPGLRSASFAVQADEGGLEVADQGAEVLLRRAAQEADEGLDALFFVVAEDRGDLALDGLLEGEE